MTGLQVRRVSFEFDESTPFQWNPVNPAFGLAFDGFSFFAPAFERYIVAVTRMAMEPMAGDEMRAEADAFLRQEALHARAHRNHVAALVRRHPGLQEVVEELDARFDRLLETRPLRFHLAYVADVEATFTPVFDMMLRHRADLFDNGDHRVAPMFLWHLVEEIEHRSSAQMIYRAVVPSPWYRLRVMPKVFAHMLGSFNVAVRGFDRHVPVEARQVDGADLEVSPAAAGRALRRGLSRRMPRPLSRRLSGQGSARRTGYPPPFGAVPRREIAAVGLRLARSQRPGYDPVDARTPPFAGAWLAAYDAGRDVAHWYDAGARHG